MKILSDNAVSKTSLIEMIEELDIKQREQWSAEFNILTKTVGFAVAGVFFANILVSLAIKYLL